MKKALALFALLATSASASATAAVACPTTGVTADEKECCSDVSKCTYAMCQSDKIDKTANCNAAYCASKQSAK